MPGFQPSGHFAKRLLIMPLLNQPSLPFVRDPLTQPSGQVWAKVCSMPLLNHRRPLLWLILPGFHSKPGGSIANLLETPSVYHRLRELVSASRRLCASLTSSVCLRPNIGFLLPAYEPGGMLRCSPHSAIWLAHAFDSMMLLSAENFNAKALHFSISSNSHTRSVTTSAPCVLR